VGGAHAQAFPVQGLDDFGREYRLELFDVGILISEVAKNITTSAHYFQFFAFHRNISFNLFNRSEIRSIPRCGVFAPCVGFF